MITLKQESTLLKKLKSLTELELRGVLEELAEHVRKNNLGEMVQDVFDLTDLRDELDSLESDYNELETEKDRLVDRMHEAEMILLNIENLDDDIQKEIDKAINELNV